MYKLRTFSYFLLKKYVCEKLHTCINIFIKLTGLIKMSTAQLTVYLKLDNNLIFRILISCRYPKTKTELEMIFTLASNMH